MYTLALSGRLGWSLRYHNVKRRLQQQIECVYAAGLDNPMTKADNRRRHQNIAGEESSGTPICSNLSFEEGALLET